MSECCRRLELKEGDLKKINNSELKSKILRWDTERWRNNTESKITLAVYYQFQREISEEEICMNDNSVLLYKCRRSMLKLGWRNRFADGDVGCRVCGMVEAEMMQHFLRECSGLGEVWQMNDLEVPICELLLFAVRREEVTDKYRRYIGRLWSKRDEILKLVKP